LDAASGLAQLALEGHAAQPGVCVAVASVLSHTLLLAGNGSEDAWDAAADAVSRGIIAALIGVDAEHGAWHASAALLDACLAEGVLCYEQAALALLPLPPPSGEPPAAAAWVARASMLLGCTQHCALAAAQASVDACVVLPLLVAAAEHAPVSQALHAVAGNALLRRALLSNTRWDAVRPCRHAARVLQVLRTGRCDAADADATVVAATADALLRTPDAVALRLTLAEVRLRLGGDASGKSGAQAVLAALAAQPDAAPVLSACVAALGPALSAELLQQSRTLLASTELLRGAWRAPLRAHPALTDAASCPPHVPTQVVAACATRCWRCAATLLARRSRLVCRRARRALWRMGLRCCCTRACRRRARAQKHAPRLLPQSRNS
jgi:hypothetical protein